jgi:hypothetical protein
MTAGCLRVLLSAIRAAVRQPGGRCRSPPAGLSYPPGMKKISHTVLTYERISTIYRLKAIIPSTHASLYPIQFNF